MGACSSASLVRVGVLLPPAGMPRTRDEEGMSSLRALRRTGGSSNALAAFGAGQRGPEYSRLNKKRHSDGVDKIFEQGGLLNEPQFLTAATDFAGGGGNLGITEDGMVVMATGLSEGGDRPARHTSGKLAGYFATVTTGAVPEGTSSNDEYTNSPSGTFSNNDNDGSFRRHASFADAHGTIASSSTVVTVPEHFLRRSIGLVCTPDAQASHPVFVSPGGKSFDGNALAIDISASSASVHTDRENSPDHDASAAKVGYPLETLENLSPTSHDSPSLINNIKPQIILENFDGTVPEPVSEAPSLANSPPSQRNA